MFPSLELVNFDSIVRYCLMILIEKVQESCYQEICTVSIWQTSFKNVEHTYSLFDYMQLCLYLDCYQFFSICLAYLFLILLGCSKYNANLMLPMSRAPQIHLKVELVIFIQVSFFKMHSRTLAGVNIFEFDG
jgi:hypothetical protein